MIKPFQYEQTTKIIFGSNSFQKLGTVTAQYGKRALLVTGAPNSAQHDIYILAKGLLEDAGLSVSHFTGVVPNPTTDSVDAGVELAKSFKADVIVGLGGGSAMDTAKAIAVAAVNQGSAWDYLFFKSPQPTKTLPCIAVSTTSGTGSQVTQVAVMTETSTQTKSAIYNNLIYPKVAIVDPALMLTVPPHITASTGFDAFCHCFESYIHNGASVYTDAIALEGIRAVGEHLRKAVADGSDMVARAGMAWADLCGGLAIANAGVTLPHGIGMTISGHCPNIMHGEALALTYPSFTRFTMPYAMKKFANAARALNPMYNTVPDDEAAAGLCEEIDALLKDIGMWLNFPQFRADMSTIRKIADRSHELPDYKNNPVEAGIEEIFKQLKSAFERV